MKLWKKLLLYSVSLTAALPAGILIVRACGGEMDPYDYYTSFFPASVQREKEYEAFHFTNYQFTYSEEEPVSEAAINSAEWAKYLGQPVKSSDVEKVMYHLDSAGKESAFNFFDEAALAADSLAGNRFLLALKDPAREAARKYYQYAQQAEFVGGQSDNYWEPAPIDTAAILTSAMDAMEGAAAAGDSFLKLRYYYQAQKFNHYAKNYEEASKIYDEHIAKITSDSHIKGWALALKAGEERRLGDTTHAAYLFSKVFAKYPERRLQAYRNYYYISAPFEDVLELAKTPEEKANLYAIKGFGKPDIDMESLEQVYQNTPASPMVGTLLLREVNKLEEYYLTPALQNDYESARITPAGKPDHKIGVSTIWLWAGLAVVLAGAAVLLVFRKKSDKRSIQIGGGALVLLGAAGIIWFAVQRRPNAAVAQDLPKGSFFAVLPDSVKTKYDGHMDKLKSFCTTLSSDGKYTEPQIGPLTNAYLCFMQNRPEEGLTELNKLNGQTLSAKLADQKQVVNLLLSAQHLKKVEAVDEASLLSSLKWLRGKAAARDNKEDKLSTVEDYNQFAATERNFYRDVLAPAYLRQGDTAKASLAILKSINATMTSDYRRYFPRQVPDFWYTFLHADDLKQIIKWKNQPAATAYMTFLCKDLHDVDEGGLYEILGTIQLRDHHYDEALASFRMEKRKRVVKPDGGDEKSYGNPFEVNVNDYPVPKSQGLSKLQFAEKMAALDAKRKADPKNADVYLQLANGLYNTSTYGNAYSMISYNWSSSDFGRKSKYDYDTDYVRTSNAKAYYLKALELSSDPEMKARCTFMVAKCVQKEAVSPDWMYSYEDYSAREKEYTAKLRSNDFFKEMAQYKTTAFYKRAVTDCSYLNDFIKSAR